VGNGAVFCYGIKWSSSVSCKRLGRTSAFRHDFTTLSRAVLEIRNRF
jgi:hypothetical protein